MTTRQNKAWVTTGLRLSEQAAELDRLRALLWRWKAKSDDGIIDDTWNGVRSPELNQLIADTTEALK